MTHTTLPAAIHPPSVQVKTLLSASLKKPSQWWKGYWQGQHREEEILFQED